MLLLLHTVQDTVDRPPEETMTLDLDLIRSQFPALALRHDDRPRVYLDNPAGTQVPVAVLDRMRHTMVDHNANMHGNFRTSREATALAHEAHVAMADFYHAASPDEIVFGPNMTTLTFMMARVLGPLFHEGDEMITTHMEHDGNNTPWRTMAAERGMVVKTLAFDRDTYEFDLDELESLITPRTRFAALNYASNILGTINPVPEMVRRLKAAGALTYVDAVQYAPHGPIDVQALGADMVVSSAYKYYGPHLGVLWGRRDLLDRLHAYKLRVVPDVPPNKFETGCQSLEGQAGVLGAIDYLQWLGRTMGDPGPAVSCGLPERTAQIHAAMVAMADHEHALSARLVDGLTALPDVRVHGITDHAAFSRRVPTVSFSHPRLAPADMANFLDAHGVYVWNGHSYALPVIEWLGLAEAGGVVRIGPTHYNTLDEIDTAVGLVGEFLGSR
jgi:cysteine desulfurase family protein (TIGR01976 family)